MKNNWKEEFKALFNSYNEDERYADLFYDFIESLLEEQKKELMDKYKDRIQKYKSYYNPVGDELNKGKHIACDDLLESLNHHD